jgi:hypothetical protein
LFHLPAGKAPPLSDVLRYSVPRYFSALQLMCSKILWPGWNCPRCWNCTWNIPIHCRHPVGILRYASTNIYYNRLMYFSKKNKLWYQSVCVRVPWNWFMFSWCWGSRKSLLKPGDLAISRIVYYSYIARRHAWLYSRCTKLNDVIIWYVLRPIHNVQLAVFRLHVVHKHTLEAASPRNISWDTKPANGSTRQVLWTAEAVRVIIWCSILIVKCTLSISQVVRHAMWPKWGVHSQLQMVHTQTVELGVWIREQTCLDERAYWSG